MIDHQTSQTTTADYTVNAADTSYATPEEQQFVTHVVGGKLVTEIVKRIGA